MLTLGKLYLSPGEIACKSLSEDRCLGFFHTLMSNGGVDENVSGERDLHCIVQVNTSISSLVILDSSSGTKCMILLPQ